MRYLLDTHVLLWWMVDDEQLSASSRTVIGGPDNELFVSSASAWEISTKHRLGKLPEAGEIVRDFGDLLQRAHMMPLSVSIEHALKAGALPAHHRDPVDRMLIAQSAIEEMPIITKDPAFAAYGVELVW